jgi:hypothetical protein
MSVNVYIKLTWKPRNPLGQFMAFKAEEPSIRLGVMTELQTRIAEIAADGAPMGLSGNLKREMFVGGGGSSVVTPDIATVEPGDPYSPSQDQGYHGGLANPDGGKYYSLRTWVQEKLGGDEGDVYRIAQSLDYDGVEYMAGAAGVAPMIMEEEGTKLANLIMLSLGFR